MLLCMFVGTRGALEGDGVGHAAGLDGFDRCLKMESRPW